MRHPANDKAPATPNTVTAFARLLRFEARFACDMEISHLKLGWPELQWNEWPRPGLGAIEGTGATGAAVLRAGQWGN